jgi:UDP-N-acetylmuramyl pentapeptide phosphotransferase/UDP-N-acetylglucosamine-1-phosphate transferase
MIHFSSIDLRIMLCFIFAAGITFFLIPSIVEIARKKSLVAEPDKRTSHTKSIPNLGGIAIFIGFIISYLLFSKISYFPSFQYILAGGFILFFIGFKDDLTHISPYKKFLGQLIAAWIIVSLGDIRITNLYGFFGISQVNESFSYLITLTAIVGITNCFNLIDGIDGLSAGLGVLALFVFGTWFYLVGDYYWVLLAAALIGSLLSFLIFNVFGKANKIFMGDTGSLTLGFIVSLIAIHFNEMNINSAIPYHIQSAPTVSIAILMIPIFDTLRVILYRLVRHRSPFEADKTHIHHYLLNMGFSHLQSTIILLGISLFFILIAFLIKDLSVLRGLIILFALGVVKTYVAVYLADKKLKKNVTRDTDKQSKA